MSYWIKGSSTDYLDFSDTLATILAATSESVATAAVNSGGSGYVVGDILTVAGGTATIAAQIEVTSVAAGVIDGIRIFNAGSYTSNPTTTANAVTGGTGSSATINLTMSDLGWTVNANRVWDGGSEKEVMVEGEGGGSDSIHVGWRTFSNVGGDYYNWELHGFTGFSTSFGIEEQANSSPGNHEDASPGFYGTYLALSQNSFNWWVNINSYRIIITANVGSVYAHAYMGWGNRYGTSSEYPQPLYISGSNAEPQENQNESGKYSSIVDPWVTGTFPEGGGTWVFTPGGTWVQTINRRATSPYDDCCVVPTQRPQIAFTTPSQEIDRFCSTTHAWYQFTNSTSTGSGGTPTANVLTTGDDDDHVLVPCFVIRTTGTGANLLLEIDECRWCNNFGGVSSEDRFIEADGTAWRVFQNGNRNDSYAYIAIKEAD